MSSTRRCIFDVFVGGGKLQVPPLHYLNPSLKANVLNFFFKKIRGRYQKWMNLSRKNKWMNRHKYLPTAVCKRREMCWNVYTYRFCKRIATSTMFFHSSCAALRSFVSTILVDLFCHICWNGIGGTYSGLWISEKPLLLVDLQVLMEWEDQAQILLLCGYRAHSREQGGEQSAHGVPSSHFKVKKTIKMIIFSITLTVTLLSFFFFFPSYLALEKK